MVKKWKSLQQDEEMCTLVSLFCTFRKMLICYLRPRNILCDLIFKTESLGNMVFSWNFLRQLLLYKILYTEGTGNNLLKLQRKWK